MKIESEESSVNHMHQSWWVQRGFAEMKGFNNSLLTAIRNSPQKKYLQPPLLRGGCVTQKGWYHHQFRGIRLVPLCCILKHQTVAWPMYVHTYVRTYTTGQSPTATAYPNSTFNSSCVLAGQGGFVLHTDTHKQCIYLRTYACTVLSADTLQQTLWLTYIRTVTDRLMHIGTYILWWTHWDYHTVKNILQWTRIQNIWWQKYSDGHIVIGICSYVRMYVCMYVHVRNTNHHKALRQWCHWAYTCLARLSQQT